MVGITPTKARTFLLFAQERPQSSSDQRVQRLKHAPLGMLEVAIPSSQHRVEFGDDPPETVTSRAPRERAHFVFQGHQALLPHLARTRFKSVTERLEALPFNPAIPKVGLVRMQRQAVGFDPGPNFFQCLGGGFRRRAQNHKVVGIPHHRMALSRHMHVQRMQVNVRQKRTDDRALRRAARRRPFLQSMNNVLSQPARQEFQQATVADALLDPFFQPGVRNAVKVAFDVGIHHMRVAFLQRLRKRLLPGQDDSEARLHAHYRDALQRLAEDLAGRWKIAVTPQITTGQTHREISRAVRKNGADLVVVGAVGEHPVRQFFLGSTAERVVREAPVPVLVVRREGHEPYLRVFAALDLSPCSQAVAELARRVAPAVQLTLGHVFEVPFEGKLQFVGASEEAIHRYRREERQHALAALHALAEATPIPAGFDIRVEHGMPDAVLPRLLGETAADLVVAGKHGASEIVDLLLGSMTKHLLREAECDVLVVRSAQECKA